MREGAHLRPHEENDVVVLDAAVRSWPPVELRCTFPVWTTDDTLDPADLLTARARRRRVRAQAREQLWMGLNDRSDQISAMRYLRKHVNRDMDHASFRLQREAI